MGAQGGPWALFICGDASALRRAIQDRDKLRVCVDGGRRSSNLGAVGFAIYRVVETSATYSRYQLLLRGGKLLEQVCSAFLAEALALEWASQCLAKLVEGLRVQAG